MQRVPETWPTVHLEGSLPAWDGLSIAGLVRRTATFGLPALAGRGAEEARVAVHCVWGWSRSDGRWTGVRLGPLLDEAGPLGSWVTVRSSSGAYSSCLPRCDAARGLLVWARDGAPLSREAGGPLRFLAPEEYWGYKGVKWAAEVRVGDRFVPGLWECRVADPLGRIPSDVDLPGAAMAESLEEIAAGRRAPRRDCRACAHFEPADDGLAYGWCDVHDQFVKLYHPPGQFWSQCQFKFLARG